MLLDAPAGEEDHSGRACTRPHWTSCPHAQKMLRARLEAVIPGVEHLEVADGGGEHLEAEAEADGLSLRLTVVSPSFEGVRPLQRQRLVHAALREELASGAVHSLPELRALTPPQWRQGLRAARTKWVEERLRAWVPRLQHLRILDVTNGHAEVGFADGSRRALDPHGLELELTVVSPAFEGMRLLERQRLVSEALGPELVSGAIHALPRLKTWTPEQWARMAAKERQEGPDGRDVSAAKL